MDFLTVLLIIGVCMVLISIIGLYLKIRSQREEIHGQQIETKYQRFRLKEAQEQMRTAWHAHQIVKKGKQVICLTAIVQATDGPGAVAAFEAQMKEVKAKMRIRSKAAVFAKPVFPNI